MLLRTFRIKTLIIFNVAEVDKFFRIVFALYRQRKKKEL